MSFQTMSSRVQYLGGNSLSRINKQKVYSLRQALKNDGNSRTIKTERGAWQCLITNNVGGLKADYDKKYISVEFDAGLKAGDTFKCLDDDTYWMVYLPTLTETAYLRSEIIRCRYTLNINDKEYHVYFQGPSETDLRWFIKNGVNVNELNLSGTIYIKNDENTKKYFKRFTKIKLDGHTWEVQVTDSISVPGIIELEVQEYYDNSIADLPKVEINQDTPLNVIKGQTVVKQDSTVGFCIDNEVYDKNIHWNVRNNPRVKILDEYDNGRMCKVKVFDGAIKDFDICYGEQFLTVSIDWKKSAINGPLEVYPYDIVEYTVRKAPEDSDVIFTLNNNNAKIIESTSDSCKLEIVSSKKGGFELAAKNENINALISVKIKSL